MRNAECGIKRQTPYYSAFRIPHLSLLLPRLLAQFREARLRPLGEASLAACDADEFLHRLDGPRRVARLVARAAEVQQELRVGVAVSGDHLLVGFGRLVELPQLLVLPPEVEVGNRVAPALAVRHLRERRRGLFVTLERAQGESEFEVRRREEAAAAHEHAAVELDGLLVFPSLT